MGTYDSARHRHLENVIVFDSAKRRCPGLVAGDQIWSAHDHQYKSLGRHAGLGVQHAKPITTRLP
jgi:hypothetical protein